VGTVIQSKAQSNDDRTPRWSRTQRAALFDQSLNLQAQGLSLRQAAKALEVPRRTLQAWRAYQKSLDEHPAVVIFFQSSPGLAFLHRLVLGLHLVCTEVGACGMRLVCLLLTLTGLDRFVAASYGIQQQVNRQVEEAIVRYRHEESARLAHDMPAQDITLAKDATFTGGLCLVAMEPQSNSIGLEQTAQGRDQDTWHALMEKARSGLNCQVIQATSDEAPGLLAYVEGSVSKVEMMTPMALTYKVLFPSISTFETPPSRQSIGKTLARAPAERARNITRPVLGVDWRRRILAPPLAGHK
jgi:hypothetical protein